MGDDATAATRHLYATVAETYAEMLPVTLHGVLHETSDIARVLIDLGFETIAIADRGPFRGERSAQGFVLARRPRRV